MKRVPGSKNVWTCFRKKKMLQMFWVSELPDSVSSKERLFGNTEGVENMT